MGCYDLHCIICGNTYWNSLNIPQMNWLTKCMILTVNNEIIKNVQEISCNMCFSSKTGKLYLAVPNKLFFSYLNNMYENKGIFNHDSCYKIACKITKSKLKYSDFPIRYVVDYPFDKFININYGAITKYWKQDVEYQQMINDGNEYMFANPLFNPKNMSRIKHIINQLKIRKGRISPNSSASFYKTGDIKYGNDKNFWIIKNGKWIKHNENIIINTYKFKNNKSLKLNQLEKYLNTIPQLGECNKELLFVYEFVNNKETTKITFIGSAIMMNTLLKKIKKYVIK